MLLLQILGGDCAGWVNHGRLSRRSQRRVRTIHAVRGDSEHVKLLSFQSRQLCLQVGKRALRRRRCSASWGTVKGTAVPSCPAPVSGVREHAHARTRSGYVTGHHGPPFTGCRSARGARWSSRYAGAIRCPLAQPLPPHRRVLARCRGTTYLTERAELAAVDNHQLGDAAGLDGGDARLAAGRQLEGLRGHFVAGRDAVDGRHGGGKGGKRKCGEEANARSRTNGIEQSNKRGARTTGLRVSLSRLSPAHYISCCYIDIFLIMSEVLAAQQL